MTIKKNFLLLSTTIIAIPLLSILFILVHNYLRSPNRLLINGTKEFNEIQDSYFSKSDVETLKRILSNLPPNVETVLFSEENEILLSSIPDFKLGEKIESQNLMKIINDCQVSRPIKTGDIIIENVFGANVISAKTVE